MLMDPKKIERINELARKKKIEGLTGPEKVEQAELRQEYIEGYFGGEKFEKVFSSF